MKETLDITEFENSVNHFFDCDDQLTALTLQAMATSMEAQRKMIAELSEQLQLSGCFYNYAVN